MTQSLDLQPSVLPQPAVRPFPRPCPIQCLFFSRGILGHPTILGSRCFSVPAFASPARLYLACSVCPALWHPSIHQPGGSGHNFGVAILHTILTRLPTSALLCLLIITSNATQHNTQLLAGSSHHRGHQHTVSNCLPPRQDVHTGRRQVTCNPSQATGTLGPLRCGLPPQDDSSLS